MWVTSFAPANRNAFVCHTHPVESDFCRLGDAQRIKVLESLLANTYSAHPKLVDWAMRNKDALQGAEDVAKSFQPGSEQMRVEKQV